MNVLGIVMIVLSVIALVIGLALSGSGSTAGLSVIAGQDLELFKKTKDRGLIKCLQMAMFVIMFALLVCGMVLLFINRK